jgi:hypothetical protein
MLHSRSLRFGRTKTLRDERPPLNKWRPEDFWRGVHVVSLMVMAQIEPTAVPDADQLEDVILYNILNEVNEAGTA